MAAFAPVTLIGVPTDIGAGRMGAAMGPDALRVAQLAPALERLGREVRDLGNLAGPPNPRGERDAVSGLRNVEQVLAWNRATHGAVHQVLRDRRVPVMMGGDHCLAVGSISAVARHCHAAGKALRVLWLDAHADFNTPATSPSGNAHGTPVASLCGLGPRELAEMAGFVPALPGQTLCQIGLRSVDAHEKYLIRQHAIEVYDMRSIDELGMREVMTRALAPVADVGPGVHLHVSFDVDFLDPEIAPGTGTTVRGGPTYREAQLCMEMIADTGQLGSLDIVELNPALDVRNQTAELVVDLVESLFGKSTLVKDSLRRPPIDG